MLQIVPNDSFDKATRHVDIKVQIYFDDTPTTFYTSDYLIDLDLIEESATETKNPMGAISANELSFSLANLKDVFTPSNPSGPYFGKIKTGVIVKPFICCTLGNLHITKDTDVGIVWIPLGEFKVTGWIAKAGSLIADVTAMDSMQDVLSKTMPRMQTMKDATYESALKAFFSALGITDYIIEEGLDASVIPFIPFESSNTVPNVLQKFSEAAICAIYANRSNKTVIRPFKVSKPAVYFTDANQIISIDTQQSILKTYNGVDLTYYHHQPSAVAELLNVNSLSAPAGVSNHGPFTFSKPLYRVSGVQTYAEGSYVVPILSFDACSSDIKINVSNGEAVALESGAFDSSGGAIDDENYVRSARAYECNVNVTYNINTDTISEGDEVHILLCSDDEVLQITNVSASDYEVCSILIPEATLDKDMVVELGAFSYLDGSKNNEAPNWSRFPDYVYVVAGSTYTIDTLNPAKVGYEFNAFFYDASKAFLGHQNVTIARDGTGTVVAPNGASYIMCHFSNSIVPVGNAVRISGYTDKVINNFKFYALSGVLSTEHDVLITLGSSDEVAHFSASVIGIGINSTPLTLKDFTSNPLSVDNNLIQTKIQAISYKQKLLNFVNALIPELSLVIRGNPLLELGDVISVVSDKYKVNFTGILKRAEYSFNGSLSCKITLLNVEVLS